jgi:hypothetical protein
VLRKYSCDCIGFEVTDDDGARHTYCVWACDAPVDAPDVGMWERPGLLEKTSEPVPFVRTIELLNALSRYIEDGQRFREVRSALGIKG